MFAQEGAQVTIVGRDEKRLAAAVLSIGDSAGWIVADLSHDKGVRALVTGWNARGLGAADVLFANAGTSNAPELLDTSEEDFDAVINMNLKSTFFTVTRFFPALAQGASVILTSSVAYHRGSVGDPVYAAAKAGVRALGRGFAAHPKFLDKKVRVNTLSFGAVATPMTSPADPQIARALDWASSAVPMRRLADPLEAAQPALFLASPASSYMTGAEVPVDGGLAQI